MSDIKRLKKKVVDFCEARDWAQFHNPKDVSLSLMLEAAEVIEHFQWKNKEEIEEHLKNNKDKIAEEVADVFYWILLMCHYWDIDLANSFLKKMEQNESKYPIAKAKGSHKKYTEHQVQSK